MPRQGEGELPDVRGPRPDPVLHPALHHLEGMDFQIFQRPVFNNIVTPGGKFRP
jgi:hypothetical protein